MQDPVYGYVAVNVEAQERLPTSFLSWMKRTIGIRNRYPVFGRGSLEFIEQANRSVLVFVREHEGTTILVACNLSRFSQAAEIDLSRWAGKRPEELYGGIPFPVIGDWPYMLTFGPHDFFWFELKEVEA